MIEKAGRTKKHETFLYIQHIQRHAGRTGYPASESISKNQIPLIYYIVQAVKKS